MGIFCVNVCLIMNAYGFCLMITVKEISIRFKAKLYRKVPNGNDSEKRNFILLVYQESDTLQK